MHYSHTFRESRAHVEHIFTPFCVPAGPYPYSINMFHFRPPHFRRKHPKMQEHVREQVQQT